ncbi:MAG: MerR family transcriptional regulator [Actinomycetota bacterium]|nr:MerR family transcriptional regulator [Actinomycetota bacterium]
MRTFTIGEVLNRLKDEFEDITISKIRFLESEGLIHPDRTESGYRKFTDHDVERLRYVLRTQRDRYLPLKVIKEELDRLDAGVPLETPPPPTLEGYASVRGNLSADRGDQTLAGRAVAAPFDPPSPLDTPPADVQLSIVELCDAINLENSDVQDLRDHGLLQGETTFDGDDLQVARVAAELMRLGLEPRHLRMYHQFADRELALYQQLVLPLLKQRNPDSRRVAVSHLDDLVRHGTRLHRMLLARELRLLLRS